MAKREESTMDNGWISVEERLPSEPSDVQVYCSDTREQFVALHLGKGRFQFGSCAGEFDRIRLICTPSHWMPLPAPPHAAPRA